MARRDDQTAVVTSARKPKSLDVAERTRRYVWTMGFRTLCFAAILFVPDLWKIPLVAAAALLPPAAVLLANNADRRSTPDDPDDPDQTPAEPAAGALTSGVVIPHPVQPAGAPADAG